VISGAMMIDQPRGSGRVLCHFIVTRTITGLRSIVVLRSRLVLTPSCREYTSHDGDGADTSWIPLTRIYMV